MYIYIIEGHDESDEVWEDLTCAMGLLREQVIVACGLKLLLMRLLLMHEALSYY